MGLNLPSSSEVHLEAEGRGIYGTKSEVAELNIAQSKGVSRKGQKRATDPTRLKRDRLSKRAKMAKKQACKRPTELREEVLPWAYSSMVKH